MTRKLFAIGFIFVCCSLCWLLLGSTLLVRTNDANNHLHGQVERVWGQPQTQLAPQASFKRPRQVVATESINGEVRQITRTVYDEISVPLLGSDIATDLQLEHRQKGLMWYPTYTVGFSADYRFSNPTDAQQLVSFHLRYPARTAVYRDFDFELTGTDWRNPPTHEEEGVVAAALLEAGASATLRVAYVSQGLDSWHYSFGSRVAEAKDFRLRMTTDFEAIDFPADSIAPVSKTATAEGWQLEWRYQNLISGAGIGMLLPGKLQPGPLAGRISLFAPVSLFFFTVVILSLAVVRNLEFHPMHFFFIAASFFAFHLLLAYLVDHVSIHIAFVIAAIVSMFLVANYLRQAIDRRFALKEAALAQFVYLVLFSYAFFFAGMTGLTITVLAVATLLWLMQLTARVDWNQVFAGRTTTQ